MSEYTPKHHVMDIWQKDVEEAFQEAYEMYPSTGRSKFRMSDGYVLGRNELISKYIYEKTGQIRTRKQVSSHIQVLVKKHNKYAPNNERSLRPKSLRNALEWMKQEHAHVKSGNTKKFLKASECPMTPPLSLPNSPKSISLQTLKSGTSTMFQPITPLGSPLLITKSVSPNPFELLVKVALEFDNCVVNNRNEPNTNK